VSVDTPNGTIPLVITPVEVCCITTISEWDALEPMWNTLWEGCHTATIFQSFTWLRQWWRFYGQGRKLHILHAVNGEGQTVGFFPLMQTGLVLRCLGAGGTDYLDFIAREGEEITVSAAFYDYIYHKMPSWAWLNLQEVRPNALINQLPNLTVWEGETCPYLALPNAWDGFTKTLSKSLRSNIGYYQRQMEKKYTFTLRLATQETLSIDKAALYSLHKDRWRTRFMPGVFATQKAKDFHNSVMEGLLLSGHLRLHTLSLDESIKAALYCFQKGTTCYYYAGGFDPNIAKLSPGTVLTAHAIRYAIEHDAATEFDFLRGDEGYKYRWGAVDRFNTRRIATRGVAGRVLAGVGHATYAAEKRLKQRMHAHFDQAGHTKQKQDTKNNG
jgi:CelD/BcsL family acetyltransferase involved in cellulose biosynthesis